MPKRIQVRDVVRGGTYELGPEEPVLRVSYDLLRPTGPVQMLADSSVEWFKGDRVHTSRVASTTLGSVHVGERVLLKLGALEVSEWWLCDVEAIDGVFGDA